MDIMRREYLRLRGRLFVLFCIAVLALLAAGIFLPRTYVSDAVLAFDSNALDAMPATVEQLRALAARHPEGKLRVETRGRELLLGWEGTRPVGLRETLKELIDALVAQTRNSLADALDADAARLEREVQAAREGQGAAQQALAAALAALPEGGDAAAGARLGKLQAEADALALEIRGFRTRQAELEARVQELAARLGEGQPDAARVQTLEQQLRAAQAALGRAAAAAADVAAKPGTAAEIEVARAENARAQQEVDALSRTLMEAQNEFAAAGARYAGLVARHASAQEELASLRSVAEDSGRRERQLRRLVDEARSDLVRLEGENEQIQQLNRAVTAADALLRDAEAGLARHAEVVAQMRERPELPYALSAGPGNPRLGSGLPAWQQLLLALAAGVMIALLRLLEAAFSARSAKSLVRLADELQVKALVELPVWRDPMSDPAAIWRRAGLVLLGLLTAAAGIVFLRVA
jgi:hypothetical protein